MEEKGLFQIILCFITEINLLALWLLVRLIPSFCVCGTVTGLTAEKPEASYTPLYLTLQSELIRALDLHKVSTEHSHQQTIQMGLMPRQLARWCVALSAGHLWPKKTQLLQSRE